MGISVSNHEKKAFLEWLSIYFHIGYHDFHWLVDDIMADERTLSSIQFVENIHDCPKGISVSLGFGGEVSFIFFKGKVKTRDVYTAYHELHLYQHEPMFLHIEFPEKEYNALYLSVIRDMNATLQQGATEQMLDKLLLKGKMKMLKGQIDKALEQKDVQMFNRLSKQLKELS